MARGTLRVYLGAAPGVGKTYAMLDEGWRRNQRGTDVAIGMVLTHGRKNTEAQLRDLEIVPTKKIRYRDADFEEMDVAAVLARNPRVCLVDEYAHTNVPGSIHEKRWQDVEDLLEAGIDVISTLNIQHLESVNDVITRITGVVQRETVPDAVVRRADQIELVDMSPEALRRRMAHGNIYPPERVDAALSNYFRPGNLGALRELALLWVADRVEESLHDYLAAHGIEDTWETRERVVVAVTGLPTDETLVRRAARMAGRLRGDLVAVHVEAGDGLAARPGTDLHGIRKLVGELGGRYDEVVGEDVASVLAQYARAEKATQLVLGETHHPRRRLLPQRSTTAAILRESVGIDIHVIAHEDAGAGARPAFGRVPRFARLSARRQGVAFAFVVLGLPLLAAVLTQLRDHLGLPADLLLFLAAVVGIAAVGGLLPGLAGALVGSILANWYFVPPIHTLTIDDADNATALVVFVAVAVTVAVLVDRAAKRTTEAVRARSEAEVVARTASSLVGEPDPLPVLLEQLRTTFSVRAVAVLAGKEDAWTCTASAGSPAPTSPEDGLAVPLGRDDSVLVLAGSQLALEDHRMLRTFADQVAVALEATSLRAEAAEAAVLSQATVLRTAILQSVSHDLRTPLASIKASVSSLLQPDVAWSESDRQLFLTTITTETDRLNRVVGNLLDMSRLQSGAISPNVRPVGLEEVVASALANLSGLPDSVVVEVPETLPPVLVDPALIERAIANVVSNAVAWSPPGKVVRVEAAAVLDRLHLQVIDQGPGIRPEMRDRVFEPFQRLGDQSNDSGAGLGLAVARGFVEALGGRISLDDTPGGGLTVTIELPIALEAA